MQVRGEGAPDLSIRRHLDIAGTALRAAGVDVLDARLLLAGVLDVSLGRLQMLEATDAQLANDDAAKFQAAVAERATSRPLQHILGQAPFRYLTLTVGEGALVPRPETETLVDLALERLPEGGHLLDAGTGTGAIAVAAATERPDARVTAVELSPAAFVWAKRNIDRLAPQVRLIYGDFAEVLPAGGTLDVLVSNPPYVPAARIPRDPEVYLYDPPLALFSGSDGLSAIRVLSSIGFDAVAPGGSIVLEHDETQGDAIVELLLADHWSDPKTLPDLTGRPRFTAAVRP